MEIILIDVGALALFLGYVALVYWHAVLGEAWRLHQAGTGHPAAGNYLPQRSPDEANEHHETEEHEQRDHERDERMPPDQNGNR